MGDALLALALALALSASPDGFKSSGAEANADPSTPVAGAENTQGSRATGKAVATLGPAAQGPAANAPATVVSRRAAAGSKAAAGSNDSKPRREPRVAFWFLGPAREISHSSSASRDTLVLAMMVLPRPILSAGGDVGLVGLRFSGLALRLGFQGMLELESQSDTKGFFTAPWGDIHFWRGIFGFSLAFSLDRLAKAWLGQRSALEAALVFRHESEHYTGSNDGGPGIDYSDRPHVGNFLMIDVAARLCRGPIDLVARLQHQFFFPLSGYTHGPGADLHLRWRLLRLLHPFLSVFGEYRWGARGLFRRSRYPDAFLVRGLLGVMLPSPAGDLSIFLSGDVGHRKGLAVYTREATLGGGVRLAFW